MALNEFELIEKYFRHPLNGAGVALGIGDDCALLDVPHGKTLAVTTDTLVADVHFPANAAPELIADRALRVNLSDLAAMGAEPLWFTLALTLPNADSVWLEGFSRGLLDTAQQYSCTLVGGDTTRGPLCLTVQMLGSVDRSKALTRAGAKPGDAIYVTGTLGDGAAALAAIQGELNADESDLRYFTRHFYSPTPRLKEGQLLAGLASAAIDVSDGLLADLGHICTASAVGATIQLEQIPISKPCARLADERSMWPWVLAGGDDYELCFTVPQSRVADVESLIQSDDLDATAIGTTNNQPGITCLHNGQSVIMDQAGYQHFDST